MAAEIPPTLQGSQHSLDHAPRAIASANVQMRKSAWWQLETA
jgi:hypothetical protein